MIYVVKMQAREDLTDENGNYVYDDAGSPVMEEMSAEELAAKEEMIKKCILRLDSGEDFDEIMAELSEYDTSAYENGFFVSSNELSVWGEGIVAGAKEAKENSIFRVNEDYAVYIVKKLPLTPFDQLSDSDISQLSSLATYVKRDKAESYFSSFRVLVTANEEILGNYTLSSVRPNPYYGF